MSSLRILVVDDEPSVADLVAIVLRHRGQRVVTAHDGAEALRSAETQPFDVVVLDLMMPRMDGMEVCRALRDDPRHDETRIVLCSAAEESSVDWRSAGADAFLPKPFDVDSLAHAIERVSAEGADAPAPSAPARSPRPIT